MTESVTRVTVTHWGAFTPFGETAKRSALGFRANLHVLRESAWLDSAGEPVTMAQIPTLNPYLSDLDRLYVLVEGALRDLLTSAADVLGHLRLKVGLVVGEEFGSDPTFGGRAADVDVLRFGVRNLFRNLTGLDCATEVEPLGAPGLAALLARVGREFEAGSCDGYVVVAVHSDASPARLAQLDAQKRIHGALDTEGVLLGEGCGALLVVDPRVRGIARGVAPVEVVVSSLRRENARIDNDESAFVAAGMTVVVRELLDQARGRIGWISSDASFEMFRLYELQTVLVRHQSRFGLPQVLEVPNQRGGYFGAALGAIQIAHAGEAFLRGFSPAPECLALLGADAGIRAGLLVRSIAS